MKLSFDGIFGCMVSSARFKFHCHNMSNSIECIRLPIKGNQGPVVQNIVTVKILNIGTCMSEQTV